MEPLDTENPFDAVADATARQVESTVVVTKEQFREAIKHATGIDIGNQIVQHVSQEYPAELNLIRINLIDKDYVNERAEAQADVHRKELARMQSQGFPQLNTGNCVGGLAGAGTLA